MSEICTCIFYKIFKIIWVSNLSTSSVPDEGYSRNSPFAHNKSYQCHCIEGYKGENCDIGMDVQIHIYQEHHDIIEILPNMTFNKT
jgi:hypothetical protein